MIAACAPLLASSACGRSARANPSTINQHQETPVHLGNFSISLAVKDLQTSLAFYKTLGFSQIGGNAEQNWLILKNGDAKIGLFQGMFEENLITFNPTDARGIQKVLKDADYALEKEAETEGSGPTSFVVKDPDGNIILVDQHE
jgi:catechol 2,3-dioxygenase-like lactoylglutathione lyase family enzyme